MKFVKRLIILSGEQGKGTLNLERNAYGIFGRLKLFGSGLENLDLVMRIDGKIFTRSLSDNTGFSLDGQESVDVVQAAVFEDGKLVVYGTNEPRRLTALEAQKFEAYIKKENKPLFSVRNEPEEKIIKLSYGNSLAEAELSPPPKIDDEKTCGIEVKLEHTPDYEDERIAEVNFYPDELNCDTACIAAEEKIRSIEMETKQFLDEYAVSPAGLARAFLSGKSIELNFVQKETIKQEIIFVPPQTVAVSEQQVREVISEMPQKETMQSQTVSVSEQQIREVISETPQKETILTIKETVTIQPQTVTMQPQTETIQLQEETISEPARESVAKEQIFKPVIKYKPEQMQKKALNIFGKTEKDENFKTQADAGCTAGENFFSLEENYGFLEAAADKSAALKKPDDYKYTQTSKSINSIKNFNNAKSGENINSDKFNRQTEQNNTIPPTHKTDLKKTAEYAGQDAASQKNNEKKNAGQRVSAFDNGRHINAREGTFFERNGDEIERLFRGPRDESLEKLLPGSRWVRINYDNSGRFYVIGLVGKEFLCYGVPASFSPQPPDELKGYCWWLPLIPDKPEGKGYWVMYQNLITGETVFPKQN